MVLIDSNSTQNAQMSGRKQPIRKRIKAKKMVHKKEPIYCICRGKDDGRPMVRCENCSDWFHFECINLTEEDAEQIGVYICNSCHEKTGLSSTMEWEGEGVLELVEDNFPINGPKHFSPPPSPEVPIPYPSSEEESAGSGDEYVEDDKMNGRPKKKNRRQVESSDGSDSEASGTGREKEKKPKSVTKRKASTVTGTSSSSKRQKTSELQLGPEEDPVRKYCLGKLKTVLNNIWHRQRPFVKPKPDSVPGSVEGGGEGGEVDGIEELEGEHRKKIELEANKFAIALEQALFETYSEIPPGKNVRSAAGKYKERFRTLSFNLDKSDREYLHARIVSSTLTPSELAKMSSAELASESTKQEIQQAHQDAMHQSIIESSIIERSGPLVKRTHKGEEVVESTSFDLDWGGRGEEEKREREMRVRIPSGLPARGVGEMSPSSAGASETPSTATRMIFPPNLVTPTSATTAIMFPPSTPTSAFASGRRPFYSLGTNTKPSEPALDLSELIDIDLPDSPKDGTVTMDNEAIPDVNSATGNIKPPGREEKTEVVDVEIKTGNADDSGTGLDGSAIAASPTAETSSRPQLQLQPEVPTLPDSVSTSTITTPRTTSFNLDLLWSKPTPVEAPSPPLEPEDHQEGEEEPMVESPPDEGNLPPDGTIGGVGRMRGDDTDFDMLLADDGPKKPVGEVQKEVYDSLPVVWSGTVNMPYDVSTTYSPLLDAKQIAGRHLGTDPATWKQLFPTINPTIDGRVPTAQSIRYLVSSRMNASRELIGVALTPAAGGSHRTQFEMMFDFLTMKDRHGLVFPWGKRLKHDPPAKELYLVPLQPSSTLPEFIDLLDDLKLPQHRSEKMLIGLWVLHKGKLVKPATPLVPTPAPAPTASSTPPVPPPTPAPTSTLNPSIAALLEGLTNIKNNPAAANINPAVLKEEMATLAPDQIQHLARILLPNQQQPNAPPSGVSPPSGTPGIIPPVPPPAFPPFPPTLPTGGAPPPHSYIPPSTTTAGPPGVRSPPQPSNWAPPPPLGYPSRDRDRDRGGGGGRGRSRDRDRAREGGDSHRRRRGVGGGGGRGEWADERPRDTGWRGRGRGHSPTNWS